MTTRSGKRIAAAEDPNLNHIEALLLAQGAWEMGAGSSTWPAIAKILSKHVLVSRPKSFFTAQSCYTMYNKLMQEAGFEVDELSSAPQSNTNLLLAQKHYQLRYDELHQLILAEENAFRTILREIEEIKAGQWDAQLRTNIVGQASEEEPSPNLPVATSAETAGDEAFSGSDLSGVTESSSPQSPAREDSETPLTNPRDRQPTELQRAPSQVTVAEPQEQVTPTALAGADHLEVEFEGNMLIRETTADSPGTEYPVDTIMTEGVAAESKDDGDEQPRREEEEEEEEVVPNKPEEEETDHDEKEAEISAAKEALEEEVTKSLEHHPEEEEEEEETKEATDETKEAEAEATQPLDDGTCSPPVAPDDQEEQGTVEEQEPPVEEVALGEGQTQTTRRSTRNRPVLPAATVTRKTRGRRRVSEPDVQSDAENADTDDMKVETPQDEDGTSSPVPVEPVSTRRRKRKSSIVEIVESPRDRKRQRDESEPPDDDEPGPSAGNRRRRSDRSEEQVALKKFQNVIGMLHSQISQHRNGNIFHNPIRTVEAPDYHDIVKRPMDLKTIKGRVKDGLIPNSLEYQRDIFLMFANAMMYNRPGSDVYHMAEDMMHESEAYINAFRQTEGLVRNRP